MMFAGDNSILAFGTGIPLQLGQFDAGWWGVPERPVAIVRWRQLTQRPLRLSWQPVPRPKTEWEERVS